MGGTCKVRFEESNVFDDCFLELKWLGIVFIT